MKKEVITHKNPKSPISEVFRTLRTNIQFMDLNKKMKVLLVTSTFPNEGKSWVASNLAVTFAQTGKRVVLIDSDMRKGRQYVIFGVSPKPGLSNFLSQVEIDEKGKMSEDLSNFIQPTEVENLYIMSAGNVPPNPSELLVSSQMIRLLEELKQVCDIVIIDGTPCELVTDSVILSRLADSTIIVTAHKLTKKDALERVIKNIRNVGGKIAGVVINKVPVSAKKYGESYYYYGENRGFPGRNSKNKNNKKNSSNQPKANATFNRASNLTKQNKVTEQQNQKKSVEKKENKEDMEDIPLTKQESINIEKTNNILKQINDYLQQEKKDL